VLSPSFLDELAQALAKVHWLNMVLFVLFEKHSKSLQKVRRWLTLSHAG
jgi:hypothetical protein